MAEIQLSGTTALTESGGAITLNNVDSETNRVNLGIGEITGMIASFAMSSAPTGWLVCNGAEYAIASYGDLYTAIGTTWGALTNGSGGAGSTHFVVPDLRGAFLRGTGTGTLNSNNKVGPTNVGDFQEDKLQDHRFPTWYPSSNAGTDNMIPWTNTYSVYSYVTASHFDSTGGAGSGRFGDETAPYNAGINYCIKY